VASEAAPVAEYQEWPFQGFLKRTRIGDDVTYNLEFKLPSTSEHLRLPINPNALDINYDAAAHSQIHQVPLKPKKSKVSWVEDDIKLAQMWNEGRSWEYIFAALPNRSEGSIRVRYSTKFKKRPRTGAGRSRTGGAADCFIGVGAPVLEEVEPSSSDDDDDSSYGDPGSAATGSDNGESSNESGLNDSDPDLGSDGDGCSSEYQRNSEGIMVGSGEYSMKIFLVNVLIILISSHFHRKQVHQGRSKYWIFP